MPRTRLRTCSRDAVAVRRRPLQPAALRVLRGVRARAHVAYDALRPSLSPATVTVRYRPYGAVACQRAFFRELFSPRLSQALNFTDQISELSVNFQ